MLGVGLGVLIANAIVRFFGSSFFAISPGWAISVPVVVVSLVLGLVGPPLMALPAIRRGTRVPVREALEEVPSLEGGARIVDRALRASHLPAAHGADRRPQRHPPHAPQPRDRRADRARGRDAGRRAGAHEQRHVDDRGGLERTPLRPDLNTVVGKPLDADADRLIRTTPGVAIAQPVLMNTVKAAGKDASLWGLPPRPMFDQKVVAGRWFTAGEEAGRAP